MSLPTHVLLLIGPAIPQSESVKHKMFIGLFVQKLSVVPPFVQMSRVDELLSLQSG